MANIFLKEPRYMTLQDYKDSCTDASILSLTDDQIKQLIVQTEYRIDNYISWTFSDFNSLSDRDKYNISVVILEDTKHQFNATETNGLYISSESSADQSISYGLIQGQLPTTKADFTQSCKDLLGNYTSNFLFRAI